MIEASRHAVATGFYRRQEMPLHFSLSEANTDAALTPAGEWFPHPPVYLPLPLFIFILSLFCVRLSANC